jgi:hypothetical protein
MMLSIKYPTGCHFVEYPLGTRVVCRFIGMLLSQKIVQEKEPGSIVHSDE